MFPDLYRWTWNLNEPAAQKKKNMNIKPILVIIKATVIYSLDLQIFFGGKKLVGKSVNLKFKLVWP